MKRSVSTAYTLVEVIVVLAIVATVVGIATPTLLSAKRSAKAAAAMQNIRQLYIAAMLYRNDQEGIRGGNALVRSGLPDSGYFHWNLTLRELFRSPCGRHPSAETDYGVIYYPGDGSGGPFLSEYDIFGEDIVMLMDMQCSDPSIHIENEYAVKKGIGILLNGSGVVRTRAGKYYSATWWSEPHPNF